MRSSDAIMDFPPRLWILLTFCGIFPPEMLAEGPLGFSLPTLMRVERNWNVMPSDPVGTVVTRVYKEQVGQQPVTFSLESNGDSVPFKIDPKTGVVTVNDTLADKESKIYSLWVLANDGGTLPQRTEVVATITDKIGSRPKIPQPPANISQFFPKLSGLPKYITSTRATTKITENIDDISTETMTSTSTSKPQKMQEDVSNVTEKDEVVTTTDFPKKDHQSNEITLTVIPIVAIAVIVTIVAAVTVLILKKKYKHKKKSEKEDMNKECIVMQEANLNIWNRPRAYSNRYESWDNNYLQTSDQEIIKDEKSNDEWEFPRHKLRIFNIVGEGAFGQVWRAQAIDIDGKKGEQTVAVKTLKENASEKEKSDLIQELIVMKNLGTHPNVVRLIGCCSEKEPTLVIMEFVSLGKLQQFLRDSRAERHYGNTHGGSQFLTSRDLTHFAYQVARGMEFLCSKGIIHRDLAARNVLITEERTCKVADFGFARDVGGTHIYERKSDGRLPIRWMAPESLYDDIFSVKSDIWSFGVLLWEIVTLGSTPYPGLSAGDVMRKVREGHRLEKPEHCRRELYNIMFYCWEAEPGGRPDFAECVTMLERLLGTETDYIELERFPDHSYYNVQNLEGEKL